MLVRDGPSVVLVDMREGKKRDAIVTITMVGFLMIEFGNRSAEFQ
jgi:hypothetical protein